MAWTRPEPQGQGAGAVRPATTLPWGLEIAPRGPAREQPQVATYHQAFLYESLWNVGVALLVLWADRRFRLGHGRAFAVSVAAYTVGPFWIEYLRVDEAQQFLGLRLNNWTSMVVFAGAVLYLVVSARTRPGREEVQDAQARPWRKPRRSSRLQPLRSRFNSLKIQSR